jgi:hypothetical protein
VNARAWLWVGTAFDAVLLPPAFYMAIAAVDVVARSDRAPLAIAIAVLFFMLPVFCIAAPAAAWRAHKHGRHYAHVAALFAAPLVYAVFLVVLLLT